MDMTDMCFTTALTTLAPLLEQEAFALCKLPHESTLSLVWQRSSVQASEITMQEVGQEVGFVIAPYERTQSPLFIRGEVFLQGDLPTALSYRPATLRTIPADRSTYTKAFEACREALLSGSVQKVVLSKVQDYKSSQPIDYLALFYEACRHYPQQYVALWHTAQSGLWLVASPEPLLLAQGANIQTVALAGTTMPTATASWDDKNSDEQAMVAEYVVQALDPYVETIHADGPHTIYAGHLAHLRTTFSARCRTMHTLGDLLIALHPTPAVCGLPTAQAAELISCVERHDRAYYTGFSGLVRDVQCLDCYVTLRCLQALPQGLRLYAGGGLLPASCEADEWQETENKLHTMRHLFTLTNSTTD